jgi:hypothetical protein
MSYEDGGYIYEYDRVKRSILVCTDAHGPKPPDKDVCAHKNDIKDDDRPENLYWATHKENSQDAVRNGRHPGWHPNLFPNYEQRARGERLPQHKLTEQDVLEIRELQAKGIYNMNELSRIYEVSNTAIKRVVHRRTWAHV